MNKITSNSFSLNSSELKGYTFNVSDLIKTKVINIGCARLQIYIFPVSRQGIYL